MLAALLAILLSLGPSHVGALLDYTCMQEAGPSPGVSLPRGDIALRVGADRVNISCHLDPDHRYFARDGFNSSHLAFAEVSPGKIISPTSISASFTPNVAGVTDATCLIKQPENNLELGICPKTIFTGFDPLPVVDFSCISENWQNLNCTWTEQSNPVQTKYDLHFKVKGSGNFFRNCPKNSRFNECYLTLRTNPPYRQTYTKYYFFFNASNALVPHGNIQTITVDHYSVVRPGPAQSVDLSPTSDSSLLLTWSTTLEMTHFPPGLVQSVAHLSEWEDDWTELDTSPLDKFTETFSLGLTDLTYPYSVYRVKVRMRSAKLDSSPWSNTVEVFKRTLARPPDRPPATHIASFEVVGPKVIVYWQTLKPWEHNGPDFSYQVADVEEEGYSLASVQNIMNDSFATFSGLSRNKAYVISIGSRNAVGSSDTTSQVSVPPTSQVSSILPRAVTKIYREDGMFDLVWRAPQSDRLEVESYTLFWCMDWDGKDRPYQCNGFMEWKTISTSLLGGVLNHTLLLPNTSAAYQLAVSTNLVSGVSSGLQWSLCTILGGKVVQTKLTGLQVDRIASDMVTISWDMDCSEGAWVVDHFVVEYCKVNDSANECIGDLVRKSIKGNGNFKIVVTDLKPFTHYMFTVGVESKVVEGVQSDPVVRRTRAAAPGSPPADLVMVGVTSDSVSLEWQEPAVSNGPIVEYQVRLRREGADNTTEVGDVVITTQETSVRLSNLLTYTPYTVSVRCCTADSPQSDPLCSDYWADLEILTNVGTPGVPPPLGVEFFNTSVVELTWSTDFQVGAPSVEKWEVVIRRADSPPEEKTYTVFYPNQFFPAGAEVDLQSVFQSSNLSQECENSSAINLYSFEVRAWVVNQEGEQFTGSWSPATTQPAYCVRSLPWLWIVLVIILVPITVLLLVLGICKSCSWYNRKRKFFSTMGMELDKLALPSGQVDTEVDTGLRSTDLDGEVNGDLRKGGKGPPLRQQSVGSTSRDSGVSGVTRGRADQSDLTLSNDRSKNHSNMSAGSGYISMVSSNRPESPVDSLANTCLHSPTRTNTPTLAASFLTPNLQGYSKVGGQMDSPPDLISPTSSPSPDTNYVPASSNPYVPFTSIRPLESRPGPPGYISLGAVVKHPVTELVLQPSTANQGAYSRVRLAEVQDSEVGRRVKRLDQGGLAYGSYV